MLMLLGSKVINAIFQIFFQRHYSLPLSANPNFHQKLFHRAKNSYDVTIKGWL